MVLKRRTAFKRLCNNLKWTESALGRGFKFTNYENFKKKYPAESAVLIECGMSFAHLEIFIHEFLTTDPEAEAFGIRETHPRYWSDWLSVLTKFTSTDPHEDELEPSKAKLASSGEEDTSVSDGDDEASSDSDTDLENLNIHEDKNIKINFQGLVRELLGDKISEIKLVKEIIIRNILLKNR